MDDSVNPWRKFMQIRMFIYLCLVVGLTTIATASQAEIGDNSPPFKGWENAPVIIVNYTDFQCPYCAKLGSIFEKLLELYPGKIKIIFKNYPLRNHKYARKAASLAMAAHQKGKFWEVHDRIFENHDQINDVKLMEIRREFGFDTPEFRTLMYSPKIQKIISSDIAEAKVMGVKSTPSVFVNGKRLKNKRVSGFKTAINKVLNPN